jgi:signal transduction histidine kinase/ActR/RegA family two-component response regulator
MNARTRHEAARGLDRLSGWSFYGLVVSVAVVAVGLTVLAEYGDAIAVSLAGLLIAVLLWQRNGARRIADLLERERSEQLERSTSVLTSINERLEAEVAERTLAEEDARRAQVQAEEANQAKSEFLSRVSHELRTPFNAVLGFAQLLEGEELTPTQHDSVNHILKAGRHLLHLVDEVLEISRIESRELSLSLEPVNVNAAVREAMDLVRPLAAERGIVLERPDLLGPDLHVLADRERLSQVLLNLLSNAVKYNRPTGSVRIWCRRTAPDRLSIDVCDEGPGISPEKVTRLFSPFERLGAEQTGIGGTGLGLALSKGLVDAMGGSIAASSVEGEGSTFSVEFSLVEVLAEEDLPVQLPNGGTPPTRTVLYVDDNATNLELVQRILHVRPDLRVMWAMQGQLGLELARQHQPELILLDLHMPELSGEDVLASLRSDPRTRAIPVVVLTADATEGLSRRLLDAGAIDYLTKPVDVRRFLDVVDRCLSSRDVTEA